MKQLILFQKTYQFLIAAILATLLIPNLVRAEDLTGLVSITQIATNDPSVRDVTISNISSETIVGPLRVYLRTTTPVNVALRFPDGRDASGSDYLDVPLSIGTLPPNQTVRLNGVVFLTYGQNISSANFSADARRMNSGNTATITIKAVFPAAAYGTALDQLAVKYPVLIDGIVRGYTDNSGQLTVQTPTDSQVASVNNLPNEGGSVTLPPLLANSSYAVQIAVDDSKDVDTKTSLRFEQIQQRILPKNANEISFRWVRTNTTALVAAKSISSVIVTDSFGNTSDISSIFSIRSDGAITATPSAFFSALAGMPGLINIAVSGRSVEQVEVATTSFFLSAYRLRVQLGAPQSNFSLPTAGIPVKVSVLNTDVKFNAISDADGYVVVPDVSAGNIGLEATTTFNNVTYSGVGTFAIRRDTKAYLRLRGPSDILNGTGDAIFTEPLSPDANRTTSNARDVNASPLMTSALRAAAVRSARSSSMGVPSKRAQTATAGTGTTVTVTTTNGTQDLIYERAASLLVARGTKKLTLKYTVVSEEYPAFVTAQSIYNDVWSINILDGSGARLLDISKQVNSQLNQEPVWRSGGTTGQIKRDLDISAFTINADATIIVNVGSTNIGDSHLSTTVSATLDATPQLVIGDLVLSPMPAGTKNDGNYLSIPRAGASNTLQRSFTVNVAKPSGSTLTTAKLDLQDVGNNTLMAIFQEVNVGSGDVQVLSQTDTSARLKIRATISSPTSSVSGVPPPTRDLSYHFSLKALAADGSELTDEKYAGGKRALWRMPNNLPRYGSRDSGFDDWAAMGTYSWLTNNNSYIKEIDDISGEHGRNLNHETHAKGTDIDAFHFYRFPGVVSGGQNYAALTNNLINAFQTLQMSPPQAATDAYNRVQTWLQATRQGLTDLTNLDTVTRVIHCNGLGERGLSGGWCKRLIKTGIVELNAGGVTSTLNFGGSFSSAKMSNRDDHNNHVHITLNPQQIGE